MNEEKSALSSSASELRILSDDEIDLVNGGSFWSTLGHLVLSACCFALSGFLVVYAATIASRIE